MKAVAMLKSTIFREYDIRGIADQEMLSPDIEDLGRAIGSYLRRRTGPRISLGRDVRLSGSRLHQALLAGLKSVGCQVTDLGVVPTPLLYYSVYKLETDGGVMITGSHNPADYNGFKMMAGKASVFGQDIQEIRRILEQGEFESGEGTVDSWDAVTPYLAEIVAQFQSLPRRVKVVVDAGNGTAGPVAGPLFAQLNLDVIPMFFEPDGNFPNHHPDPTVPENLAQLADKVRESGADLGIAFDGDTDRIGAVDENGEVVYGDMLTLIYGREILTRKPGATFISEVKCSQILYDELARLGGNPIMYKTGHSLIKTKMKQEHAELAGEMSGHMFFADRYYGFDDAIYAACRLLEIVAHSGKPLSAQLEGLPKLVTTPELRIDCPDEVKFEVVSKLAARFKATHRTVDVDGVRVLFDHGWGLVRASNTQPVLVMRFEAATQAALDEYRHLMESAVAEARA
jgi:phosphomannomutase/phosphoglucomutase